MADDGVGRPQKLSLIVPGRENQQTGDQFVDDLFHITDGTIIIAMIKLEIANNVFFRTDLRLREVDQSDDQRALRQKHAGFDPHDRPDCRSIDGMWNTLF